MRCRRMMFPASIWIKSNERAARWLLECDRGFMVSAILAERNSRLVNALAGACRTQDTLTYDGVTVEAAR